MVAEEERPLIVAVDDEPEILRILELALEEEGFEVVPCERSVEALPMIRRRRPSLVLLDLLMPQLDGLTLLDQIRQVSAVPVVILTAKGADRDVIAGLDRGADDYVSKPFNLDELAARVRAVLRRSKPEVEGDGLGTASFGSLHMDFVRREVTVDSRQVALTRNEWRLLEQLARSAGRVITREELLTKAWGADFAHDGDYLRVWMSRLRRKLSDAGADPDLIRTVSGVGYAFGLQIHTPTGGPSGV
jgi:two-component system KDP operon response regulator KdpE